MRYINALSAITALGLATLNAASAVELTDVELAPRGYARVVMSENPGKREIVFGTGSFLWKPASMNKILNAYGLELDADKVEELPSGYAAVREVETEEGTKKEVFFFDSIKLWRPRSLDRIFNAYGVQLDPEKMEDLPNGYASVKTVENDDGTEETKIVFSNGAKMWHPASIDKILSAYQ